MNELALIIEDDPEMNRLLQLDLEQHGYESAVAVNGLDGLRMFHEVRPNLVVLDVALPQMDGLTVCQRIRELSNVPILIMTAHAVTEEEIARGLNLGADEYMLKPIRNIEFHARVKALLRRAQLSDEDGSQPIIYADDYLIVDVDARRVWVGGQETRLTPTEFKLLAMLMERRGRVQTRDRLLTDVWGYEGDVDTRTVDTHVRRLREKLGKAADYIETVRGVGYRFAETT